MDQRAEHILGPRRLLQQLAHEPVAVDLVRVVQQGPTAGVGVGDRVAEMLGGSARNLWLDASASRAAASAFSTSARVQSSAAVIQRCSQMSWPKIETPLMSPSASGMGEAVATSTHDPLFVNRAVSWPHTGWPTPARYA